MNDRYLFKAKHIHILKNSHLDGIWVKGYLVDEKYIVSAKDGYEFLIDPRTICQCTGLKDMNGKLIWENDIVRIIYDGNEHVYQVIWDNEELNFWTTNGKGNYGSNFAYIPCCEEIEVIGNKFDNPELLESEE